MDAADRRVFVVTNTMDAATPAAQNLGAHWRLNGSLLEDQAFSCNTLAPYGSTAKPNHAPVVIVRRKDSLSPLILAAQAAQFVIPLVTFTTSTGQKVNLTNARVTNKTDSSETELIELTFQKIQITWSSGKKHASDDWKP